MSKREFKGQQGYLSFALGSKYLKLAYLQALSIKTSQKNNNYAIIIDNETAKDIVNYKHAFDEIIILDYTPYDWDMSQYHRAFGLSPWRETVLLDADIIFTTSIDHWWDSFRLKDVCITKEVKDFREHKITSRRHRKLFDENLLPDVYGGFVYFRYTQFAAEFFSLLRHITINWNWIAQEHFIKNEDMRVRIDEMVSLATRIMGIEHLTLPNCLPTFVHAKETLWNLSETKPWYEQLFTELDGNSLIVGHYHQRLPFHYHHKEWVSDNVIREFERIFFEFNKSSR